MRKPLVMGNWKLNGTKESVTSLVNALKEPAAQSPSVEVAVCAPAIFIGLVESLAKDTAIKYGSEDVDVHTKGAFTGENSPEMIKEFGCKYAIVGHSERRAYHNETNEVVAAKYKAAQESGLRIPEDVQVLAEIGSKYSYIVRPQVSSFSIDMFKVGSIAVRMLTKLLNEPEGVKQKTFKIRATFNKRETTK